MSEQTRSLVDLIKQRLHATVRRMTVAELVTGAFLITGIIAAIILLAVGVEASFWLDVTPRKLLFWTLTLVIVALFIYYLFLPILRLIGLLPAPKEYDIAHQIGTYYPSVSDRLIDLLDLADGHRSDAPPIMVDRAVRMLSEEIQGVQFEKIEDFGRARKAGRLAALPVAGVLLFLIAAPTTFLDASHRLLKSGSAFQRPAPFEFVVEPGSTEILKGQPLEITIRTRGAEHPDEITLALNNIDEKKVDDVTLTPDSAGVFRHTLVNIRHSFRYQAQADKVKSDWFDALIAERPLVRTIQVTLEYPAYTGIPPQRLDPNIGDVSAYPGTIVSLEMALGGPDITEAQIVFDDGAVDSLSLHGSTASGSFILRKKGSYQISLMNTDGVRNANPITYTLSTLTDAFPGIVIEEPEPSAILNEQLLVPLQLRITDDFGFSKLQLFYRLAESQYEQPEESFTALPIPIQNPRQLDQAVLHDWLLSRDTPLDPVPGDVIEYFVQVWDNDSFSGFKSAKTPVQQLRLPTLSEQYDELQKEQDTAESLIENLLDESQSISKDFDALRDELRRKQEGDWEDQRQLEQIQQRQKQVEDRVEELSDQIESITESMQENNLVKEQTLETYRELQKVASEINSPELQEALRQLQEAMQNLDLKQLQEALGNFEFNEEQFQNRLERALSLFKKLRLQQSLDEAARRAAEIAKQQKRLAEETEKLINSEKKQADDEKQGDSQRENETNENAKSQENEEKSTSEDGSEQTNPNEELARDQENSRSEMEQLLKKLEEMRQQASEVSKGSEQQMQKLNDETKSQKIPEKMQENSEQLRNNQLNKAQEGQMQMEQTLQQLESQLNQMQQQMQQGNMQINMAGLRRALDNVLTLSQQQEELRAQVQTQGSDGPQLRSFAQRQVELAEGLSLVSDSLQKLSRDIPQMSRKVQQESGNALQEMGSATQFMAERVAPQASGHQKGAMMHLNELALLLSDLMNQMMNGASGGEGMSLQQMIEQLQKMSGQQQQLNQELQQMLNDMQGNRLANDAEQRLRQLSQQQEVIRRQLKEMSRNPATRGKLLGDLEKIAEQMEETIKELQRGHTDRRTIERQKQILTRLLDAQRSLRERGEEKRRESRSGNNIQRQGPGALPPAEQAEQLRRDLLRALESGYAPDYEELIKRYFELLQQQSNDQ